MRPPRILMCPPTYYGIEYEINPWMSRARGSTPERAARQWQNLHDALTGLGVQVEKLTPQPGRPDLVRRLPHPQRRRRPPVPGPADRPAGLAARTGRSPVLSPRHVLLPPGP